MAIASRGIARGSYTFWERVSEGTVCVWMGRARVSTSSGLRAEIVEQPMRRMFISISSVREGEFISNEVSSGR